MKLKLLFILAFMMISLPLGAQKLSKLPQAEREKKLLELAEEVYQRDRFKEFYRLRYGEPLIKVRVLDRDSSSNISGRKVKKGEIIYEVYFFYDKTKERLEKDFAAMVAIYDETGHPIYIALGNGYYFAIKMHMPSKE